MQAANPLTRCISYLLILSVLLQYVIIGISAVDLKKSFSFSSLSSGHEPATDPLKYADDSLMTRSGKSNKVSKLLRLIHNKAGDVVYRKVEGKGAESDELIVEARDLSQMSDDAVISGISNEKSGTPCKYAVKAALKTKPEERRAIANAIRHKPGYVESCKVLYHKLFESAIAKAEAKNIDEKIDAGINLLATKNAYGWAANKALDMAIKSS